MKVFNKGLRTVQFNEGEISPQEVITLDDEQGKALCKLFAGEIVDLADSEKELTKGSKKGKSSKKKEAAE